MPMQGEQLPHQKLCAVKKKCCREMSSKAQATRLSRALLALSSLIREKDINGPLYPRKTLLLPAVIVRPAARVPRELVPKPPKWPRPAMPLISAGIVARVVIAVARLPVRLGSISSPLAQRPTGRVSISRGRGTPNPRPRRVVGRGWRWRRHGAAPVGRAAVATEVPDGVEAFLVLPRTSE